MSTSNVINQKGLDSGFGTSLEIYGVKQTRVIDQDRSQISSSNNVTNLQIQQDAPVLASFDKPNYIEIDDKNLNKSTQKLNKSGNSNSKIQRLSVMNVDNGVVRIQTVSNILNGTPIENSHPECSFCAS